MFTPIILLTWLYFQPIDYPKIELPKPIVLTNEQLVKKYAKQYWVDESLALRIWYCESWLRTYAKNKKSSARWIAQFLTQDFKRKDWTWHISTRTSSSKKYLWYKWNVYNPDEHIRVFIMKLKNEWSIAWKSSSSCRWKTTWKNK